MSFIITLLLGEDVEELIQEDSHVEQYLLLFKGELKMVWEWQDMKVYTRLMLMFLYGKTVLEVCLIFAGHNHCLT